MTHFGWVAIISDHQFLIPCEMSGDCLEVGRNVKGDPYGWFRINGVCCLTEACYTRLTGIVRLP